MSCVVRRACVASFSGCARCLIRHVHTETLWRSAWQTYLDILLDYSAAVKPIFLREIEEAMTLEKTGDAHYPGKIGKATSLSLCVRP